MLDTFRIDEYYDRDYNILTESEDEDQLYGIVDGRRIFRVDHQVDALVGKIQIPENALICDYGCGKGTVLKRLLSVRPDVGPHLFDVSKAYVEYWKRFSSPENWAFYSPKPEWKGRFDIVTSLPRYGFKKLFLESSQRRLLIKELLAGGSVLIRYPLREFSTDHS